MGNYSPSSHKLQKRSTSASSYPRYSRENVSISESALSFGETQTLSDQTVTEVQDYNGTQGKNSSILDRECLRCGHKEEEPSDQGRSHRSSLWWATEILVLFSGLLCLVAILIVLWRADGRTPPQWPLNTNLNTIVAFLASLAKAAFVMAIVEGLGQLKWIWFLSSRPRPLSDFQVFDEATKGGWGSWKLLFRFKGFLASFGALILVSGLMTSTFTQMAITYPVVNAESNNGTETATVERATGFSVYNGSQLVPGPFEAVREQQAVYQGGFYPPNEEAPHVEPICSSGDCTWPTYGSLAVCSDVVNLTAQGNAHLLGNLRELTSKRLKVLYTSIASNGDIYGWTNFQQEALPGFYPVILGPMLGPSNALNDSIGSLILNDNFIAYPVSMMDNSNRLDMQNFHFLGLTFWWCTKSYSTQVKAGGHTTTELATRSEPKLSATPPKNSETLNMAWSPVFYPCYTAGTCDATFGPATVELEPPAASAQDEKYTVHVWTGLTVSGLLAATMWDSVLLDPSHGVVTSNGGGIAKAMALAVLGDFQSPAPPPPAAQLGNARAVAGNIARTITNLVRTEARHYYTATGAGPGPGPVVSGTVYTPQAFVRVHWGWMSVLSLQLGCTLAFLLLTMWATAARRMQVLKSSSLATLCALRPDARRELGGIVDFGRLQEEAGRTRVRLERAEEGLALWLDTVGYRREGREAKTEIVAKGEELSVKETDTRRQGRVFDGYDSDYLGRLNCATGGSEPLGRLMTRDD